MNAVDGDGVTAWFSQTQRAFDRAVVDAHTGRPGSYCPLCADDGPCEVWMQSWNRLRLVGEVGPDGSPRAGT